MVSCDIGGGHATGRNANRPECSRREKIKGVIQMAKVTGPLMSISASGKIADTLVFGSWKGRNVVRQYIVPANPQSDAQGHVRAAMLAISKGLKAVENSSSGGAGDSQLFLLFLNKAPAGLNWNAFISQLVMAACSDAGAFSSDLFQGLVTEYGAVTAAAKTILDNGATALGLTAHTFGYGYTTTMAAGFQLYLIAKAAYLGAVSSAAPFSVDPADYTDANATAFVAACSAT